MRLSRTLPIAMIFFAVSFGLAACGGQEAALDLGPEAQAGRDFAGQNCLGCHTVNGDNSSGPTWKGLYGSEVELKDGRTVTADDEYLLKAILEPSAEVAEGFNDIMGINYPPGTISEDEARQVIEYIKALSPPDDNS